MGPTAGTVGWSGRLEFCWHGTSSFIDSIPSSVLPHMKGMLTAGALWSIIPPAFRMQNASSAPGVCGQWPPKQRSWNTRCGAFEEWPGRLLRRNGQSHSETIQS
jgi:hypothetical protein